MPDRAAEQGEIILVIEDEPVVRGQVIEVLCELGYHALEAANRNEGLAMLQSKRRIDLHQAICVDVLAGRIRQAMDDS